MSETRNAYTGGALMVLFAISGFAGLIYESIWTQYLGLFLGHAAYAQSFVLMLFMGGMALGAWLVSRRSAQIAKPLAAYAAVELLIGVLGVAFDPFYRVTTTFAYDALFPLVGDGMGLGLTRYAISTLLIGVQCIALGATFPLMSAGYLRLASREGGRVLASLYFSNSFGAAIGALVATFVLIPNVGLPGTVMTGGLLSVLVALLVWPLGKEPSVAIPKVAVSETRTATPWLILCASAITGATSFVYEMTWIRMLALALGSTLHAFELMLAAFVGGIAFGGLWLRSRADRWPDAVAAAGWVQVLMGIAALGSLFVYAHSFEWVAALMRGLSHTSTGYALYNVHFAAADAGPVAAFRRGTGDRTRLFRKYRRRDRRRAADHARADADDWRAHVIVVGGARRHAARNRSSPARRCRRQASPASDSCRGDRGWRLRAFPHPSRFAGARVGRLQERQGKPAQRGSDAVLRRWKDSFGRALSGARSAATSNCDQRKGRCKHHRVR
jgi:hypothetical protein